MTKRPVEYIIIALLSMVIGRLTEGEPIRLIDILASVLVALIFMTLLPFIRLIICNIRQKEYHG